MTEVLLLGEPMVLLTGDEVAPLNEVSRFRKSLAGAELNVAIGLKRLDHSVAYISQLGKDAMGEYIKKSIYQEGIDTQYITLTNKSFTGLMMKNQVKDGDPEIAYFRKGSAFSCIDASIVDAIDFRSIKHLHLTGIPLALSESVRETIFSLIKKAKEYQVYLSFDPNIRESLWTSRDEMKDVMNHVASLVDLFIPGISEARVLSGLETIEEISEFYHGLGVKTMVMKLGAEGALISEGGKTSVIEGFKVETVVDTVGAGDGFAVGLISGRLEGLSVEESVKRANAIGAIQIMTLGDNEGLPNHEKLEWFINENNKV